MRKKASAAIPETTVQAKRQSTEGDATRIHEVDEMLRSIHLKLQVGNYGKEKRGMLAKAGDGSWREGKVVSARSLPANVAGGLGVAMQDLSQKSMKALEAKQAYWAAERAREEEDLAAPQVGRGQGLATREHVPLIVLFHDAMKRRTTLVASLPPAAVHNGAHRPHRPGNDGPHGAAAAPDAAEGEVGQPHLQRPGGHLHPGLEQAHAQGILVAQEPSEGCRTPFTPGRDNGWCVKGRPGSASRQPRAPTRWGIGDCGRRRNERRS